MKLSNFIKQLVDVLAEEGDIQVEIQCIARPEYADEKAEYFAPVKEIEFGSNDYGNAAILIKAKS